MKSQRGFAMTMALYLIGAVAVVGLIGGGIWKIHHAGYEKGKAEVQLAWDQAKAAQREKEAKQIDTATTKLEKSNAQAKVVYRTITRNVDRIIDRPIYRDRACFDDDGLRIAREALRGPSPPTGKPDAAVPTVDGPRERPRRDGAPKTD